MSEAPTRSRYRLRLPYATLPALRLVIGTPARVFERHVLVWVERPSEQGLPAGTAELASADWRHAEPESPAPPLVLSLPAPGSAELSLSIDEGDNTPLPLERATILLPSYRIRFFGSAGQPVRLLYGQPELSTPRYDLALLATRLVGAAAHELTLAPDKAPTPAVPAGAPVEARLFWGILVLAVAAFLVIIVRLMKKEPPRT